MANVISYLKHLSCDYCIHRYNFTPKCLKRKTTIVEDDELREKCDDIYIDMSILKSSIKHHFDYEKNKNNDT